MTGVSWSQLRRRNVAVAILVFGSATLVAAPHYLAVQAAHDESAFREMVAKDGRARVAAAALMDFGFAAAYAMFAATFARRNAVTAVGSAVTVAGAAGDIVENSLVLAGLARLDARPDGTVALMGAAGRVKWTGVIVGGLLIAVGCFFVGRPLGAATVDRGGEAGS
jgi:hypothetical protein